MIESNGDQLKNMLNSDVMPSTCHSIATQSLGFKHNYQILGCPIQNDTFFQTSMLKSVILNGTT